MCDEREPLLTYLYDESDPAERQRVEAHLATCETCRDELAGLRQVREDLLAWDVPDHGSVWKPFTPARPSWSWRDVPAWTLAAAAAIMFAIGAASSVAANAWLSSAAPRTAVVVPGPSSRPDARTAGAAVTKDDLIALEARVLKRVDTARTDADATVRAGLTTSEYDQLLNILVDYNNSLIASRNDVKNLNQRVADLSNQVALMAQAQQGGQGGR